MTAAEQFRAALDTFHQSALSVSHEADGLLAAPDPQRPCCPRPDLYLTTVGLTETQRLEWVADDDKPGWQEADGGWDSISIGEPAFVQCTVCHSVFTPPADHEES